MVSHWLLLQKSRFQAALRYNGASSVHPHLPHSHSYLLLPTFPQLLRNQLETEKLEY